MNEEKKLTQNKKLILFYFIFLVYACVNFVESIYTGISFKDDFNTMLQILLAYLLIDLLGGDVINITKLLIRFFMKK